MSFKKVLYKVHTIFFTTLLALTGCDTSAPGTLTTSDPDHKQKEIKVVECSTLSDELGTEAVRALTRYSYTRCALVFGVLIANSDDSSYFDKDPSAMTEDIARIHAEIIDNDQDTKADNTDIVDALITGPNGSWINIMSAENEASEELIIAELSPLLGRDTGIKHSWLQDQLDFEGIREVTTEELIHNWQLHGLAAIFPDEFSVAEERCLSDESSEGCEYGDSTVGQLAYESMITADPLWYQHPENTLPDENSIISGTCATTSCAAIEFYMNLLVEYRDIKSATSELPFPENEQEVIDKLNTTDVGKEMLSIMDDPKYDQLQNSITYSYRQ